MLNDCKNGYSAKDNVLRITLLKSGKFPDTQADMGRHVFTCAVMVHEGCVTDGKTIEEAFRLNLPVRILNGARGWREADSPD